jgi:hypothetical protein
MGVEPIKSKMVRATGGGAMEGAIAKQRFGFTEFAAPWISNSPAFL